MHAYCTIVCSCSIYACMHALAGRLWNEIPNSLKENGTSLDKLKVLLRDRLQCIPLFFLYVHILYKYLCILSMLNWFIM